MKIGVVVCSNSGLDYLEYDKSIKIMRCALNIEQDTFYDYVDISAEDFYERITNNKNLKISTSQPTTGEMIDILDGFKKDGHTDVIVITISSKLSGTLSGMHVAASMVEGINVHLFDSKSLGYCEAYLAITAAKMAKENKKPNEIIEVLENLRKNAKIYVCVDTLHYLMLNGRLSTLNGVLGTMLQIKPLLHVDSEGTLTTLEKIRTKQKSVARVIELVLEDIKDKKVVLFAAPTNNLEEATQALEEIASRTNATVVDKVYAPLTPVVGCHAGPKTFGIGFIIV